MLFLVYLGKMKTGVRGPNSEGSRTRFYAKNDKLINL
jgi:hypothetical protein